MRFMLFGPRLFHGLIRPGVSFDASDLRRFAAPASRAPVQGSFVYVVKGDHGRVKIGVSTNPTARLASLQTGSPFPLEFAFVGATPGNGYDIEAAAHVMIDHLRTSGEWFVTTPAVAVAAVQSAAFQIGQKLLPLDSAAQADEILRIAARQDAAPAISPWPWRHYWLSWFLIWLVCCAAIAVWIMPR